MTHIVCSNSVNGCVGTCNTLYMIFQKTHFDLKLSVILDNSGPQESTVIVLNDNQNIKNVFNKKKIVCFN